MLVEQLATAYKFHSAIGNSIDLKEMIYEVLRTFVSESYASYGEFCIRDDDKYEKISSFGKIKNFNSSFYMEYDKNIQIIETDELTILKINLDRGVIFLANVNGTCKDCTFLYSLYESLIPKLNLSVNACLNFQELETSHELLKKRKEELIKANKTKDDFLANMSHELKTPLNSIIVISSLMAKNKNDDLNEKQLKNIRIIKKSADDLLELINDILDISKIEAGKLTIFNEKLNLKSIFEELFDSFSLLVKQKEIEFNKKFIGKDFYIYTDEKRLKQILKNLISNAIKFTNNGSVNIKIEELENKFKIDVIDTGIGIDKSNLINIFDRFKQVDNSRTRKYSGTGLGLAISNELAFMLGGALMVYSELNHGSTFTLEIPKGDISVCDEKEINKIKENHLSCVLKYNVEIEKPKKNLLIRVSDDLEQFKLTISFKKEGYNVIPINDIVKLDEIFNCVCHDKFFIILDKEYVFHKDILNKLLECKDNVYVISNIDKELAFNHIYCNNLTFEELKKQLITVDK